MTFILAALVSAILYRWPRGGPSPSVWREYLGFGGFGSRGGTTIWAVGSALAVYAATGAPWWTIPALAAYLTLAEMPGYMKWVSDDKVDVRPLTIRGLLLLNPLMGVIYWLANRYAKNWPKHGSFIDGWTAYAELACGFVTGLSCAAVLIVLETLI